MRPLLVRAHPQLKTPNSEDTDVLVYQHWRGP
jgi:hypothetical protein